MKENEYKTKTLINTGRSFKKSAERSLEQRPIPNGQFEMLIVPAVVNLAFSIELYLKFLLAENGIPKSHKLSYLFSLLNPTIKQEIIDLTKYNEKEFNQLLEKHSDIFIEWRYIFEANTSKNVNIEFMMKLANCVESTVIHS